MRSTSGSDSARKAAMDRMHMRDEEDAGCAGWSSAPLVGVDNARALTFALIYHALQSHTPSTPAGMASLPSVSWSPGEEAAGGRKSAEVSESCTVHLTRVGAARSPGALPQHRQLRYAEI